VTYYGRNLEGAHLPFNFQLISAAWSASAIAGIIREYEAALPPGAWPNWVLANHDKPRIASRVGTAQARVAAMLLLTLRGTPTIYYGDELGMTNVAIPPDRVQDPAEKNQPGLGLGRDPVRTPMAWDASPNGGFTSAEPWLPLGPDYRERNVARLADDPTSIQALYRALIALRRAHPALSAGDIRGVSAENDVLRYDRHAPEEDLSIALNLSHEPRDVTVMEGRIVLSTYLDRLGEHVERDVTLRAAEGIVVKRSPQR
jgi:alpha-glucosidase